MGKLTKKVKRGACGCSCLTLICIIAIPAFLILKPGPEKPVLSPAIQKASKEHVKEVRQEIEEIKKDAAAAKPHPFSLVISENDINTFLSTDHDTKSLIDSYKLDNVFVKIEEGNVKAYASRWIRGMHVNGVMAVTPQLSAEKTMILKMEGITVGALGLPKEFADKITAEFSKVIVGKLFDSKVKFNSLEIKGKQIIGRGDAKAP